VLGLIGRSVGFCLVSSDCLRTTVPLVRGEADCPLYLGRFLGCCLLSLDRLHTMAPFARGEAGSRLCLGGLSAAVELALAGFLHRFHSFR
jgi:hypothetical protein